MIKRILCLLIALSFLLVACGGDNQPDAQQGTQSFVSMMSAEVSPMSTSASTTVTAEMTMDWAEHTFPELFPRETVVHFPAIEYEGVIYNARAYVGLWETSYLGITVDGRIFGLGGFTGGVLTQFETIDYWAAQVLADLTGSSTLFAGLWEGAIPYQVGGEAGTFSISLNLNSNGSGQWTDHEGSYQISGNINGDTITFALPNPSPSESDCANWNVSVTATLNASGDNLSVSGSGTFCSRSGGTTGKFSGIFLKKHQSSGGYSDIGTVTSLTGRVWMDRNLGASRVATAHNDSAAYGDLYQWGRGTDGHEKRTSPHTTTLSSSDTPGHGSFIVAPDSPYDWRSPQNDNLWQGVSGVNNPCPSGFRLPTIAEWEAERVTWASNDRFGAFASPLRLVSAGYRSSSVGGIYLPGSNGGYWSSSVTVFGTHSLDFGSFHAYESPGSRASGKSVRCIAD